MSMLTIENEAPHIEALIGYAFTNKSLCMEAVQMSAPQITVISQNCYDGLENNKRLSVLGDAVLAKVLCGAWFEARDYLGNPLSLTQWTIIRNDLLSNDALAHRGICLGLATRVIKADNATTVTRKMLTASLEALVGAVWQDGGDEAVRGVMQHLGFFDHELLTIPSSLHLKSGG